MSTTNIVTGLCGTLCRGICCYGARGTTYEEKAIASAKELGIHLPRRQESESRVCRCVGPQGCLLPREHRPAICTEYICDAASRIVYDAQRLLRLRTYCAHHATTEQAGGLLGCRLVCDRCPAFHTCDLTDRRPVIRPGSCEVCGAEPTPKAVRVYGVRYALCAVCIGPVRKRARREVLYRRAQSLVPEAPDWLIGSVRLDYIYRAVY